MKDKYKPTLESLDTHPLPEWYDDAKLGMFIDWGLYSIAGWAPQVGDGAIYPDWYLWKMYHRSRTRIYHRKTWGREFECDDFIPLFTASEYDPEQIVQLAIESGMRYIIPFSKMHDGFCLWDSSYSDRNSVKLGPKRDLIRELADVCHKADLKFGLYFSIDEWVYPMIGPNKESIIRIWKQTFVGYDDIELIPYDYKYEKRITGKIPVKDFSSDYIIPQAKELIENYDPELLWLDGEWGLPAIKRKSPELLAFYYNQAEGRKEVVVNDRLGVDTKGKHGDFFTSEFHDGNMSLEHKWEECRSLSQNYGYYKDEKEEDVLTEKQLIHMLIDIISQGGNLLLMLNLTGLGAIPPIYARRFKALGEWLEINGEAIYATRMWKSWKEDENIRFTMSKDGKFVYTFCLEWEENQFRSKIVRPKEKSKVYMLGVEESLEWKIDNGAFIIEIPPDISNKKPCEHAWVIKIEI
ncbi:MAG: alpha-L-fucosidase [Candidatus Lokiarchaeota archaeon]|nr:alpha-L-fucosidase [Candidatus Lokiarchaeota archaeon]